MELNWKINIYGVAIIILLFSACSKTDIDAVDWEYRHYSIPCYERTLSLGTLDANNELTFSKDHMFCINIEMEKGDFELMRNESRFGPSVKEQGGLATKKAAFEYLNQCDVSFPSHFNWYRVNLLDIDNIWVDGKIRKKGFLGSIFSDAPSIKINLNRYEPYNTTRVMDQNIVFNNNSEDPSRVIQAVFYKLLEWANYPAPRCNLANISINEKPLGVYSHVEAVDDKFLLRHFGSASGDLYECQLTDFRASWLSRWECKTEQTDGSKYRIAKIAQILSNTPTDKLLSKLRKYVNIQKFIKFWALEVLMNHTDGYARNSNNTYVYFDPNDNNRAVFIPSGINYYVVDHEASLKEFTTAELPRRLSRCPDAVEMFEKEMKFLLDNVWNENALIALVDHFQTQAETAEDMQYTSGRTYIDRLKSWIQHRKRTIPPMPRGKSKPSSICHFEHD